MIQTIIDACDSKEQDSANTTNSPFGKVNINDMLQTKPKDFYGGRFEPLCIFLE